jgi:membrane protease YdiL (CAAX protease family)
MKSAALAAILKADAASFISSHRPLRGGIAVYAQQLNQTVEPIVETPVPPRGLVSWLKRHPLVGYFTLAYAGTWLTVAPIVLSKSGVGALPYEMPFPVFAALFILSGFLGPTLAAFVMTRITTGKAGVRLLLKRYVQWRVGIQWYALILFGYVALYLLAAGTVLGIGPLSGTLGKWPLLFTLYLPTLFTFNLVTSLGEEPGWRGFALPRLELKYGPVGGSAILGLLHGMWHLPVFFLPALGFGHFTLAFFASWVPALVATTTLWTWVFNNTKGSLLIAIILHAAADAAGSFVLYTLLGVDKMALPVQAQIGYVFVGALVGTALLVIALTRGRLSYHREEVEHMIYPAAQAQPASAA